MLNAHFQRGCEPTVLSSLAAWSTRAACVLAVLLAGVLSPAAAGARPPTAPAPAPFRGSALWVTDVPTGESGAQLVARVASAGAHVLYLKAAEGSLAEAQYSSALVGEMRDAGATVCAWTFVYGQHPVAEAAAAIAAVRDVAQCLVVDAEGQYDGLYGAAQLFVRTLRSALGAAFPIGLAGQAEVTEHPGFPYSVFLGPGAFNVDLPQMYWLNLGVSVDRVYAAAMGVNAIYGDPILPVGQLEASPSPAELLRFRALASAYGAPGSSFFDLDVAQAQALPALAAPPPSLARRPLSLPTIDPGADGDEIVRAQELLNAAGAELPVGGFFGAATARAVASFQSRHHLPRSGVLTASTWKVLLRFRAREPSWANGPPDSAR